MKFVNVNVTGIIFSNLHDGDLPHLTGKRTMGAVPFGGRYRLVDFPLSAMVNAGVTDVRVIAHHNYQSLMEHIGAGKDWDLARRLGGIRIVPPYSQAYTTKTECYDTRLQSFFSIRGLLERVNTPDILCADCDMVGTPDLRALLMAHRASGAGITLGTEGDTDKSLHIFVAKTDYLRELLKEAQGRHYTSFTRDIIERQKKLGNVGAYGFENRFFTIRSFADYYGLHMLLVENEAVRSELLENRDAPVYTATRVAPPVKYGKDANVKNSLIADGCVIAGEVKNSVLFGGVCVGEGCVVENAILMENCTLTDRSRVAFGVMDKNAAVFGGATLHGHQTLPIFVEEGRKIG